SAETAANCPDRTTRCDGKHCVVAPTSRGRRRVAVEETDLPSSVSSFGQRLQESGAPHAKSLASLLKQLLGNGEVHQRRVDIFVPEIGDQVREARLRIDTLAVPGEHAARDEGMTKIVYTRTHASRSRFAPAPLRAVRY